MQRARSDAARRLSALLDEIEELSPGLSLADLQAAASRIVSMAPAVQHKSGSKRPRCEQEQSAARVRVGDAVPQADGFQLHLSDRSATGYAGVTDERVKGLTKPYHATAGKYGGKRYTLVTSRRQWKRQSQSPNTDRSIPNSDGGVLGRSLIVPRAYYWPRRTNPRESSTSRSHGWKVTMMEAVLSK